jgi:hypothetical protein
VHELDVAGLGHERGDRRRDEALPLAEAHDERALLARAHQHARVVGRHRDERVVAAEVVVGEPHGLDQIPVEMGGDQVRHHLGVRLGGELGALGAETVAELGPVLDDAVEDDVEALRGVPVRVGVRLRDAAVRGPARVADAGRAVQVAVRARDRIAQVLEVPDGMDAADRAVGDER